MANISQLHGFQGHVQGVRSIIKQQYNKDIDFKNLVDYLYGSKFSIKDLRRALEVVHIEREYFWNLRKIKNED